MNLWFACNTGALTSKILNLIFIDEKMSLESIFQTNFPNQPWKYRELFAFFLIGILGGVFGSLYVIYIDWVISFRRKYLIGR